MSNPHPPALQFGNYAIDRQFILYQTQKADIPVMTGLVWIDEPVTCPETGNRSYLLEIQPFSGGRTTLRVTPENMTPRYLKKMLGERGIIIHEEGHLVRYLTLTASLGDYHAKVPRTLIETPGWFADGKGFYTGRHAITAQGVNTSRYRFEPVGRSPVAVRGTLASWKENVAQHIQRNPVLLAVTCLFLASPFLKTFGLGSRLVNLYGPKGTAKTTCSQCAATIWGNGIDPAAGLNSMHEPYVTKFATTINGIEPLLARYTPFPIALDEMTEQTIAMLGELIYKIASGEGKRRMNAQAEEAPSHRWLLTVVSTAERSIADAVTKSGKPLLGGQADRAIDVPIEHVNVINDYGTFPDFQSITRHLKKACSEHYGSPGQTILQYAVDHPEQVKSLLDTLNAVEDRLMPANCGDGERRVVKFMAAAVVAGHIAIAAGVFDCSEETVESAVKLLVNEWWYGRGGSLRRIAEFLVANERYIRVEAPTLHSTAKAFIDNDHIIIPTSVFDQEFGVDARSLVDELSGLNAIKREQPSRTKSRFCNNRLFAYVIKLDRVEPILNELMDSNGADDAKPSNRGESLLDEQMD
jgi:hypothetical protein